MIPTSVDSISDSKVIYSKLILEESVWDNTSAVSSTIKPAQILHNAMCNLINLYQSRSLHSDRHSKLISAIKQLDDFFSTCKSYGGLLNDRNNQNIMFSEEVELFRDAVAEADLSKDSPPPSREALSAILFIDLSQLNINDSMLNILYFIHDNLEKYKNKIRVRKQKSERNFKTITKFINSLNFTGATNYAFQCNLFLSGIDKFNVVSICQAKNLFLRFLRNFVQGDFKYIWFLEYHRLKGYSIHFICFYNSNLDIPSLIQSTWKRINPNIENSCFLYNMPNTQLPHRTISGFSPDALLAYLGYMCFREMHYKIKTFETINTFGKGDFLSRKLRAITPPIPISYNQNYGSVAPPPIAFTNHFNPPNPSTFAYKEPIFSLPPMPVQISNILPTFDNTSVNPFSAPSEFKVKLSQQYDPNDISWYPFRGSNPFLLITGLSGSGKSNTLMLIASESTNFTNVWVFDPHNSMSGLKFEKILFSSGSQSNLGINPLTIYANNFIRKGLHDHKQASIDIIKRATGNLGRRQLMILQEALYSLYDQAFDQPITTNDQFNNSVTFTKLIELLKSWSIDKSKESKWPIIESCIGTISSIFSHPLFSRDNWFDVKSSLEKNLFFDLSALANTERYVVMESLLRQVFAILSQEQQDKDIDQTKTETEQSIAPNWVSCLNHTPSFDFQKKLKLLIVIDEARLLMMMGKESAKDDSDRIINVIVNEGRKYGIGLVLATQRFEHVSQDIRTNIACKLIHKTADLKEARAISAMINVLPSTLMELTTGKAIFFDGKNSYYTDIQNIKRKGMI